MSWEREKHYINLEEGEHVIHLTDKTAVGRDGGPARHILQIRMGEGAFEYQVGHNSIIVKLGGDFTVKADGTIVDSEGTVFDPKAFEQEMITRLNAHHAKLRTYAAKHGVPHYAGPKKGAK